jgi:Tfp pilus assembly protein PilV
MTTPSTTNFDRTHAIDQQRGLALIEAMVSALLFSIVFLGLAFVLSRGLANQRYMNTQGLALLEMRQALQTNNDVDAFCDAPGSLGWIGQNPLPTQCTKTNVGISVALPGLPSANVITRNLSISTSNTSVSQSMLGGDGVMTVSY